MLKDRLLLAGGAAVISFAPILVKLTADHGIGPTPIALWRLLLAGAAMAAFALLRWRRLLPPGPVLRWTAIAGLSFALDLYMWHASILIIGAGMSTILGNTQVFWTALIGALLLSERLSARFVIGVAVAFGGVVLLVGIGSEFDTSARYLLGVGYGIGTGVTYAGFILSIRHAGLLWTKSMRGAEGSNDGADLAANTPLPRAFRLLAIALLVAGFALIPAAWIEGQPLSASNPVAYLHLALLVIGPQILGWLAISTALPRVPATAGALIFLLQPTLAAVWGVMLFDERFTWLQLAGAVLVLGGVYLGSTGPAGEKP